MSGVINQINNVLTRFIGRIIGFQSGGFVLGHGEHKFIVDLNICPKKVWVNTEETVADGCGHIPVNKVGCTYLPNRIVFEAIIETDTCKVEWFATT